MSERFFEIDPFDPKIQKELALIDRELFIRADLCLGTIAEMNVEFMPREILKLEAVANILWELQPLENEVRYYKEERSLKTDYLTIAVSENREKLLQELSKAGLRDCTIIGCYGVVFLFQIIKLREAFHKNDLRACIEYMKNVMKALSILTCESQFVPEILTASYNNQEKVEYNDVSFGKTERNRIMELINTLIEAGKNHGSLLDLSQKGHEMLTYFQAKDQKVTDERKKGGEKVNEKYFGDRDKYILEQAQSLLHCESFNQIADIIYSRIEDSKDPNIKKFEERRMNSSLRKKNCVYDLKGAIYRKLLQFSKNKEIFLQNPKWPKNKK